MSTLGATGRLGNQVLQYAFLALYARRHGLEIETPEWSGRRLFGLADRPVQAPELPVMTELEVDVAAALAATEPPFVDVDLWGWFLVPTAPYADERAWLRRLFRPVEEFARPVAAARRALAARGRTIVGLHLRRGDFRSLAAHPLAARRMQMAPLAWYRAWLETVWPTLDDPVLFVASDDQDSVLPDLARFRSVSSAELGVELPAAPDYLDFSLLSGCHLLAISNSCYSFAASLLAEECEHFLRPDAGAGRLVAFDPWASEPQLTLPVTEFVTVPGIADGNSAGRVVVGLRAMVRPALVAREVEAVARFGDELRRGRWSFEATAGPVAEEPCGQWRARWSDHEDPEWSFDVETLDGFAAQALEPALFTGRCTARGARLQGPAHYLLVFAALPARPGTAFVALTLLSDSLRSFFVEAPASGTIAIAP